MFYSIFRFVATEQPAYGKYSVDYDDGFYSKQLEFTANYEMVTLGPYSLWRDNGGKHVKHVDDEDGLTTALTWDVNIHDHSAWMSLQTR